MLTSFVKVPILLTIAIILNGCSSQTIDWKSILKETLASQAPNEDFQTTPHPKLLELVMANTIRGKNQSESKAILSSGIELLDEINTQHISNPENLPWEMEIEQKLRTKIPKDSPKDYTLNQWTKEDGAFVSGGEVIALLNLQGFIAEYKSTCSGRLVHKTSQGDPLTSSPIASVVVGGDRLILPLVLASVRENPQWVQSLATLAIEKKPEAAHDILLALVTELPDKKEEILSLESPNPQQSINSPESTAEDSKPTDSPTPPTPPTDPTSTTP